MIVSFDEIIAQVVKEHPLVIAVAAAQDEDVLQSVFMARERKIADAILVGDEQEIHQVGKRLNINIKDFRIVHEKEKTQAAKKAVSLVHSGEADMVMKGFIGTADLLRAVLDKEIGLRTGRLLSHVTIFEPEGYNRLFLMSDGAMVIAPDLKQKVEIIENAAYVARVLGITNPKVAPVCALELVNPDMPASIDAAILTQMSRRGQIKDVIIDGPLALDNAVSLEAAKHKGITGDVAGQADILLMPDIEAGNVFYKSLGYFSKSKFAGVVAGAKAPVILTSRADRPETKLYSMAAASFIAQYYRSSEDAANNAPKV